MYFSMSEVQKDWRIFSTKRKYVQNSEDRPYFKGESKWAYAFKYVTSDMSGTKLIITQHSLNPQISSVIGCHFSTI